MAVLRAGMRAPEFALSDSDGAVVRPGLYEGRKLVVYFYPKDDTPGCTVEAIQFSAKASAFDARNTVVLGISADTAESHCAFSRKHGLSVRLLSDPDHTVCDVYGVWQKKVRDGVEKMGIARTTFLIDERGAISRVWEQVHPEGHADEVLSQL